MTFDFYIHIHSAWHKPSLDTWWPGKLDEIGNEIVGGYGFDLCLGWFCTNFFLSYK